MTRFYLGMQEACWLGRTDAPGFLSARRLARLTGAKLPRGQGPWVLDSGGFTMLESLGGYTETWLDELAALARMGRDRIGRMQWVATPDWMCEPVILERTGLTIEEHQRRTVAAAIEARRRHPDLPWAPVLQGWSLEDYLRCLELYQAAGLDLAAEPVVGLGTICRRQSTAEAVTICQTLADKGLKLHAFGLKTLGLRRLDGVVASADSMAWSIHARRNELKLPGCTHRDCRNCLRFALQWRERITGTAATNKPASQMELFSAPCYPGPSSRF